MWIDIILNTFGDKGHPFHLHGHDFYVLAQHAPSRVRSYDLSYHFDGKDPVDGLSTWSTCQRKIRCTCQVWIMLCSGFRVRILTFRSCTAMPCGTHALGWVRRFRLVILKTRKRGKVFNGVRKQAAKISLPGLSQGFPV